MVGGLEARGPRLFWPGLGNRLKKPSTRNDTVMFLLSGMTQLMNKLAHKGPEAKCYITCGSLREQSAGASSGRRPYSTILSHVDLLLPDEVCDLVQQKLDEHVKPLQYHRIFMSLKDILEKEFYNHYVRQGNVLLLSDGRIDVDNVYCLYDGVLYLFLRKETYEKAGLVGKKAVFGGRNKERWVVEYNLRQPHMVHGRRAFDRLVWSFTNVLKEQKAWLFCDLNQESLGTSNPGSDASSVTGLTVPTTLKTTTPSITRANHPIKLITFNHTIPQKPTLDYDRAVFYDWAYALHEWLALASINADRLHATQSVDPLLSRYEVPTDDQEEATVGKLARISWRGFIPAEYISKIFDVLQEHVPGDQWFAITVHGFQNAPISWKGRQHSVIGGGMGGENLYTILRLVAAAVATEQHDNTTDVIMEGAEDDPGRREPGSCSKYIMWEVVGGRDEHS
ncbi:hypothetical protein Dda_5992 [Drechslerella dactyloides]|uniref:Uncharacterized protein n=1 Tax=Drechslerella dactyloides TaxID=74499 RepID=A0AAD6IWX0_DREDA|nr:hypothetical protein Dda_5992 [Drechslerella dactyloides]